MTDHPFAGLAGSWRGEGHGSYPTIGDFDYAEELTIAPVAGRPVAGWSSRTRDLRSGEPRHAESGFLRATPDRLELVLAHSFGIVELSFGRQADGVLRLSGTDLHATPGAKPVERIERRYAFTGHDLSYSIAMAAVGQPMTHHLSAQLHRTERDSRHA